MNNKQIKTINKEKVRRSSDTHKVVSAFVACVFFALILIVDVFLIIDQDHLFSENENRVLQQMPSVDGDKILSGKFMKQFEAFLSDQFFERDYWIQTKLKADRLIGKKESNGVYLGKEGYLFEDTAEPDLETMEQTLDAVNQFAKDTPEVRFVMSVVPNASTVYPHLLPDGAPLRDQLEDISWIESQMDPVHFVNVYDALAPHINEQLYYRSDHHWSSLGAKYAFLAIAPALGLTEVSDAYQVKTVTNEFTGTMASASGSFETADSIEIYIPDNLMDYYVEYDGDPAKYPTIYKSDALEGKDKYQVFFGGNYPKVSITTHGGTGRNLLLVKDSYANCFVQFLLPYYDKIIMIDPRYYSDDIKKELQANRITDVLLLYNENTFSLDKSLFSMLTEEP